MKKDYKKVRDKIFEFLVKEESDDKDDDPVVGNSGKPGTLFKSRETDFQKEGERGTANS